MFSTFGKATFLRKEPCLKIVKKTGTNKSTKFLNSRSNTKLVDINKKNMQKAMVAYILQVNVFYLPKSFKTCAIMTPIFLRDREMGRKRKREASERSGELSKSL